MLDWRKQRLNTAWKSAHTRAKFPSTASSQDHLPIYRSTDKTLEEVDQFKYSGSAQTKDITSIKEEEAHQLVGQAKRRAAKIRLEAVTGGVFDSFFRANSRPKVVGHVISGVAAE